MITFLVIIVLIGAVGGMFIWLAPGMVAKSCESLGFDSLSLKMYERVYIKDKTVNNLHKVVDKAILFGNNETLIKYYPELESHADYTKFIAALDEANYDENVKVIVNLKLSNEDNRLKTRYVAALAKGDFDKAFDYAAADLYNTDISGYTINFCITGLAKYINETNAEYFVDVEKGKQGTTICQKISQLYTDLKVRYDAETTTDYNAAVMSGKLIDMIQFMLLIEGKTQNSGYDKTALTNDLAEIFAEYKQYID